MTINLISYQLSSCCHMLLLDFYSLFPGRHVIKISSNKISQPRDSSKASWVNGRVNEDLSPSLFHGQKINHLFQSKVIGLLKRNWWTTREILLLLYIYTGCFLFSYFIVSYLEKFGPWKSLGLNTTLLTWLLTHEALRRYQTFTMTIYRMWSSESIKWCTSSAIASYLSYISLGSRNCPEKGQQGTFHGYPPSSSPFSPYLYTDGPIDQS